ncbi:hypothetical protein Hanom_Chr09g00763271 [Helianthus anomalus]
MAKNIKTISPSQPLVHHLHQLTPPSTPYNQPPPPDNRNPSLSLHISLNPSPPPPTTIKNHHCLHQPAPPLYLHISLPLSTATINHQKLPLSPPTTTTHH